MSVTLSQTFSNEEMQQLVDVARQAIADHFMGISEAPTLSTFPQAMQNLGACFVTLEINDILQGCLGCIVAHQPLIEEIYSKAQSVSYRDRRFAPLKESQLKQLSIEVSVLSPLQSITVSSEKELEEYLLQHPVGVILSDPQHSAVFLPQVWHQLPTPRLFLQHLKIKAGWNASYWSENIQIQIFSVQSKKEAFTS